MIKALHVGCGARVELGWTNVDLEPSDPRVVPCDVRRGLPFADGVFDLVYSEHFIEHIERHEAYVFLMECHRVMKPGGALRLSTPDMEFLARLYLQSLGRNGDRVADGEPLDFYKSVGWAPVDEAELINGGMRLWDHRFIWDGPAMARTLVSVGFDNIVRAPYRSTRHEGMLLEGRPNLCELIVECIKPIAPPAGR